MVKQWNEKAVQQYIDDQVEESQTLEYKGAGSLGKQTDKKTEMTKDVSAMANSAGGILMYGVAEYRHKGKRHLPEKIDPVDRTQFSREWLEQVIGNIRPRVEGLKVYPVDVAGGQNDTVYVVEIPQSTTAHQATDHRYYKRYNFQSVSMDDQQVRAVRNRGTTPQVAIDFGLEFERRPDKIVHTLHTARLTSLIVNEGHRMVQHVRLEFTIPDFEKLTEQRVKVNYQGRTDHLELVKRGEYPDWFLRIVYTSKEVMFPSQRVNIGQELGYSVSAYTDFFTYWLTLLKDRDCALDWTLYADEMPPKTGTLPWADMCASAPGFK